MIELQAIGNIGKDAEQKTLGGNSYASFSIAVTEKLSDGKEKTTWLRVMKSDKEGKLTPYLTKGTKVWVKGNPHFSAYINKNTGEAVADTTIWADKLEFCSSAEKKQQSNQQTQQATGMDSFSQSQQNQQENDDLPF